MSPQIQDLDMQEYKIVNLKAATDPADAVRYDQLPSPGGSGWDLTGNAGTTPGTNFLGTTDNQAFEIFTNNLRCVGINPADAGASGSPDFLGGHSTNYITGDGVGFGNVICGGGTTAKPNGISDSAANFIGSGYGNLIVGLVSSADDCNGMLAGRRNTITRGFNCSIMNGQDNVITGVATLSSHSIVGGDSQEISANASTAFDWGVICGGFENRIKHKSTGAFIGGGIANVIEGLSLTGAFLGGEQSVICGGNSNNIKEASWSSILGGGSNLIEGNGTGAATPDYQVICGGYQHRIRAGAIGSAIIGGIGGDVVGAYTTILGGRGFTLGHNALGFNGSVAGTALNFPLSHNVFWTNDLNWYLGNSDGTARTLYIYAPNTDPAYGGGTHSSSLTAQTQTADIDYVLPAAAGTAGQQLTIDTVVGTTVTLKWA